MNKAVILFLFLFLIPLSIEDGKKNEINQKIADLASDLMDLIGNSKGLNEAISGIDKATGKNLAPSERLSSILKAFPFEKYSKNKKNLKKAKRLLQAAERARKLGDDEKALTLTEKATEFFEKIKASIEEYIQKAKSKLNQTVSEAKSNIENCIKCAKSKLNKTISEAKSKIKNIFGSKDKDKQDQGNQDNAGANNQTNQTEP